MSRLRRVTLGTGANLLSQAINAAGQWLLVPLFLIRWGNQLYGEWLMLAAAAAYVSMLDLGLQTYVVNRLNQSYARGENGEYARVLQSALLWSLTLCAAALLVVAGLLSVLPFESWFRFTLTAHPVAAFAGTLIAAEVLASIPAGLLTGLYRTCGEYPRGVMVANAQQALFFLLTGGVLLFGGGLRAVALVQLIPLFASSVFAWLDLRRRHPELELGLEQADARLALSFLGPSSLFFLIQMSMGFTLQGSTLLVGATLGAGSVAAFVTLRTLSNAVRQLYGVISHALWPELTALEAQGRQETLREVLLLTAKALTAASVCAAVFLHFAGGDIVALWTRARIVFDQRLLDAFLLLLVAQTPWLACSTVLMASNRHRSLAWRYFAAGALGLVAGWPLSSIFGPAGIVYGLFLADLLICQIWVPLETCGLVAQPASGFFAAVYLRAAGALAVAFATGMAIQPWLSGLSWPVRLGALAVAIGATGAPYALLVWLDRQERSRVLALAASALGRSSIGHWTPRYALNRSLEFLYRRRNPGMPWLTPDANRLLETHLSEKHRGLEFGSGRSTVWFAQRVGALTSVEHDAVWHAWVAKELREQKLGNVEYLYREDGPGYVKVADSIPRESLDFVLVDGVQRDACALAALDKLRPGGVLIVDNANWNLPQRTYSPASRRPEDGPATEGWARFLSAVGGWRRVWTSNGVTDTALYFKP